MSDVQLQCPSCGASVELGAISCPNCGVNLKSGEAYESQVKRARGQAKHHEGYTGGLYVSIAGAFMLMLFVGYMYQRSVENIIQQRPEIFVEPIEKLQALKDLVDAGQRAAAAGDHATASNQYKVAADRAATLIKDIQERADSIELDTPFAGTSDRHGRRAEDQWNRRGGKRLLGNLKAKAEYLQAQIPAS